MGILANGFRDTLGVFKTFGATASNNAYPSARWANSARTGANRNLTAGQGITDDLIGLPSGYRHPSCWMLPQKAGALASRNLIRGGGDIADLNLAGGVNGEAALSGSGDLTGTGALIISMVAALSGSGTISSASANAFLNLAAELAGSGDLTGAITAIAHASAALSGEGDVSGTINALGTLAAAIVVTGSGLTTSNVGQAVWSAIASANNEPGTMGEKLNDAGSAANPWTETLPGAYVAGSAGYILGNQLSNILAGIGTRLVESGMSQDEVTRIMLAALSGTTSGLGTSQEVYHSVDGTIDRLTVDFDANSNRTAVVMDGS